jgi:hypothetical protein
MRRSRFVLVTALAGAALFSWAALAQEAAESKASLDAWYLWSLSGKPCGYFHAVKKSSEQDTAPVLFVHDFRINAKGQRICLRMQTFCKDDPYFTPVRIVSGGEGEEATNMDATIERPAEGPSAGKLKTTLRGRNIEIDVPEHTVTDFALFEIVRTLPFDKEKVFEFNSLEASELNLKRDHKVVYVGRDELDIEGRKQALHKFEQSGKGIRPCYYWVNEDRQLVRVLMDGRKEFLLTTKEKATAALGAE